MSKEENMSEQAIDQGHERFLAAMGANDADALMQELSDDVTFMPPGQAPARGKAAVRAWYEGTIAEATTVEVQIHDRGVVVADDSGIESGSYVWTLSPVGGGEPFATRGSFIAIWRKESDGAWRITSDIWNSSDPTS
jgi:uncharacterized protein (TIGR02246 family)